ncbi:MAG: cysteine-rich CWC family protein [Anaerolineae bacterium]|nr:cysteine-rich CWC family protein [Anaerolineae bacterium]
MTDTGYVSNPADTANGQRICPRCGAVFVCGIAAGDSECWCFGLPHLATMPETDGAATCLCPDCLHERITLLNVMSPNPLQEPDED